MTAILAGAGSQREYLCDSDYRRSGGTSTSISGIPALMERRAPSPMEFRIPGGALVLQTSGEAPDWLAPTAKSMAELLWLEENWDSYGAAEIDPASVGEMLQFLCCVLQDGSPPPSVVPTSSGGVQVEWHKGGVDLEIEVLGLRRFEASFEDSNTGEEWDGAVTATDVRLLDSIARLP